jgi:cobalt-zinc-cadmium efflux system membrane fusion protein
VHVGEILFRIESLELGVMVSEYLQAIAEEEYHRTRFERIRRLSDQEISSESELDRAMSDLKRATTIAKATYSKLRAAGISGEEIARYRKQENIEPVLNIRSPISGTLDMRRVDVGQQVSEYQDLGTVIDNSHVMVRGYLSPEDGRYVRPGDSVFVHRRVETSLLLPAVISSVNPGLDEANRSAIINIYLELEGNWPRPGENVKLDIRASTFESLMAIPLRALTYDGNEPVVFIRTGKNAWEERSIEIGEMRDTSAVVISGLDVGEKLAVSQVFSLKALSRIEQIAEE